MIDILGDIVISTSYVNDIYTKTQKLMDEFLNSVSDQEFLDDYLTLERFNGPLVKDFLNQNYFIMIGIGR